MNVMMHATRTRVAIGVHMQRLLVLLLVTAGALLPPYVEAGCVGTSVAAFGAKGDGHTDDTASIPFAAPADA
jgi:hypothetical protein